MENPRIAIRETIIAAFANAPYPGDDRISAPNCDDEGTREYFQGKTWRGHSPRDLRRHSPALSYFTPEAYRYFLPAYLLAELDDPEAADVIAESIVFDFTKASSREVRLRQFSKQELIAVAAFFDECARRYPACDSHFGLATGEVRRFSTGSKFES